MIPTIIKTSDGSHSLYSAELNEHYHSIYGAIQESNHVFINAGFKKINSENSELFEIKILEIGLGTGLNVFLTFLESEKLNGCIRYHAIEAFPLTIDLIEKLNYVDYLTAEKYRTVFNQIHTSEWEKPTKFSDQFIFTKVDEKIQDCTLKTKFNLIYFDAFGPRVQPEMWTEEVFSKLYSTLELNGYLVTYCAKGQVKRTLKKVGFSIESLPGPAGKREMIRAFKK